MRPNSSSPRLTTLPVAVVAALTGLGAAPYEANPTLGAPGTPAIDGANSGEWGPQNLIYRGLANDDPRTLGDNWSMHEAPWDLTHLYAAWDDEALTLAWQLVDVTDVVDPNNAGSSAGTSPRQMNLPQWIAIDTVPGAGSPLDMWGKNYEEPYWTGTDVPDHQIYLASNLWQGYVSTAVDGVFPVDDGGIHYFPIDDVGIEAAVGATQASATLLGVDDADRNLDEAAQRDFMTLRHDAGRDSFYELRIPLAALGLDRAGLEAVGLGVMVGQGEGSCLDTLPHDPATLDTPGVSDSNSPLEWADVDRFTVRFARVAVPASGEPPPPPRDGGVGPEPDGGVVGDAGSAGDAAPGRDVGGVGPAPDDGLPDPDAGGVSPRVDAGTGPTPPTDGLPELPQDAGVPVHTGDSGEAAPAASGGGDSGCTTTPGRAPLPLSPLAGLLLGVVAVVRRRRRG